MKKYILVDAISMFRMRYLVAFDENTKGDLREYAMDTVVMNEAKEFSQEHLDEVISSAREVTFDEAIRVCDEDNDYLKTWPTELKVEKLFTIINEEEDND